ncbi:hypothetical protein KDK82_2322 [Delftia sp. K82]|uniref:hypothetical protein n=1 Tax=Delftia sp. K82 TaxID=1472718 RepID=UPI000B489834|nr:hypothetical protein [Delftia sp. K82]OWG18842.1 hypothetical protein KDK82_2322 [Delftia sp. K82]
MTKKPMFKPHPDGQQYLINLAGCVLIAGDAIFGNPAETTPQGRTNAMQLVERVLQEAEQRGFKHTSTVWALMRRNTPNPRLANLVQEATGLLPNEVHTQIMREAMGTADQASDARPLVTALKHPGQHEPETNPNFRRPGPSGIDPRFIEAGQKLRHIRETEGNEAIHKPEHAALYRQFMKYAPEEFQAEMVAMAKKMNLMPEPTHVGADGQAVFSAQQIADKHGVCVEEVERFIAQSGIGPGDLYDGPVFPLQ